MLFTMLALFYSTWEEKYFFEDSVRLLQAPLFKKPTRTVVSQALNTNFINTVISNSAVLMLFS